METISSAVISISFVSNDANFAGLFFLMSTYVTMRALWIISSPSFTFFVNVTCLALYSISPSGVIYAASSIV